MITQNEIIFWRHGQAGWGNGDFQRSLTTQGQFQAESIAAQLIENNIDWSVFTSQALRSQQTASYYNKDFSIMEEFNPNLETKTIIDGLAKIKEEKVIIVGHLPWIANIVNELLSSSGFGASPCEAYQLIKTPTYHWEIKNHWLP